MVIFQFAMLVHQRVVVATVATDPVFQNQPSAEAQEEQGCNQGFDALCKSFTFLFGGLEEARAILVTSSSNM